MAILVLIILGALMHAARSYNPTAGLGGTPAGTTVAFGFLLLSGFLAGNVFHELKLPRLTGYLFTGLVVGPGLLNLVSEQMVVNLRIFNGVAVSLIALTAGSEMDVRVMRPYLRTILFITGIAVFGTSLLLALSVYLLQWTLPFAAGLSPAGLAAVAAVLGVAMVAQSPAVAVALRDEMKAEGPVSKTVLGVVVGGDLLVIVMFALTSSLAKGVMGHGAEVLATVMDVGWEVFGSLLAGLGIGVLLAIFLQRVSKAGGLFILIVGFVIAEVGQRVGLDPLLIALATGMYIRNATAAGDRLLEAIESGSMPIYVAFFCVAGATIHLEALRAVGAAALLLALVRGIGLVAGARIATRLAQAPLAVQRYAGYGLLPQAGLALALALLFGRIFPNLGTEATALIFAVVAINELIAPILYRQALVRSGEAGAAAETDHELVGAAPASP